MVKMQFHTMLLQASVKAKNGPITKYKAIVNAYAYPLLTRDEISKTPFVLEIPIATIPRKGSPMAVIRKPKFASQTFSPCLSKMNRKD